MAITHGSPDHGYPPELIVVDLASDDRGVVAVQGAYRGDIVSDDTTLDQTTVADMDRGGIRETIASFVVVVKDAIAHDAAVPGGQRGAGGQNSVKPLIAPVLPKHAVVDHTISGVYTPAISPLGITNESPPYETMLNRQVDEACIIDVKTADIISSIHHAIIWAIKAFYCDGFVYGDGSSQYVGMISEIDGVTFYRGVHRGLDVGGGLSPFSERRRMISIRTHIKVSSLSGGGNYPNQGSKNRQRCFFHNAV
ncbi:hypothetical protein OAF02_03845, partial [Akkermansiaceae bacterium]|nr:hypothetical protein [Akkermansiaceae bacterium]